MCPLEHETCLGHRNIKNTLIYTHLVEFEEDDNYTSRVTSTVEEAQSLVESGFEFVATLDGNLLFRKRK